MSDIEVPNFENDQSTTNELSVPVFQDAVKQRWDHDTLCNATMTAKKTATLQGRPQLEITLISKGARQKFWARIGEPRSNWILSRFVLPYVNEAKKANGTAVYAFGTELMAETTMQYVGNPWIQSKMESGIEVRVITTVRDSSSQNSNRTVSLEYVHCDDSGSQDAFESIKNLKEGPALARAKQISQAVNDPF